MCTKKVWYSAYIRNRIFGWRCCRVRKGKGCFGMILFNRTTEIIENPDDRWAKMKNKENLDYIYKQNLEEFIIEYLSKEKNL